MKESYAIETRHLTKRYGEQVAVNDVCLHVPKGHIYGLLGRNGAGKTSIMKLILQLMPATSGETLLFGEPVKRRERSVFQLPEYTPPRPFLDHPGPVFLTVHLFLSSSLQLFRIPREKDLYSQRFPHIHLCPDRVGFLSCCLH